MRWHYTTTNTCFYCHHTKKLLLLLLLLLLVFMTIFLEEWIEVWNPLHAHPSNTLTPQPNFWGILVLALNPFSFSMHDRKIKYFGVHESSQCDSCKSHQILKLENDFPLFRQSQWYRDRTSILLMKDNCSTVLQEVPMRPSWKKLCLIQNTPCIGTSSTERAGSSKATSPPKISAWPEQHEN